MPRNPHKQINHISFSYYELADAMGYSYSYLMNAMSKRGIKPREMTLVQLIDFICKNANPKKLYISFVRQSKLNNEELGRLRQRIDDSFQGQLKEVAAAEIPKQSTDDDMF